MYNYRIIELSVPLHKSAFLLQTKVFQCVPHVRLTTRQEHVLKSRGNLAILSLVVLLLATSLFSSGLELVEIL